jgi:hypothetical protein
MQDHTKSVFEKSAHKLVSQAISNGWICASNEYMETFEGQQLGSFRDGLDTYLIEEQYVMVKHVGLNFIICFLCFYYFQCTIKYVQVSIAWLKDRHEVYRALCKLWASEEFIAKSMRAQECRGTGGSPGHRYGPNGYVCTSQQMVRKIVTKNKFTLCFFLLTHTHRSMQVVNSRQK